MAKILYITANPKAAADSFGLTVGNELVRVYRETNPDDEIVHLDLYREEVPLIDGEVLSAWGKLGSGAAFDSLSESEQHKAGRLNELLEQFIAADQYIFVSPIWNFGMPPMMKAYLDAICIAGKTFKYTEEGQPVGLLQGRKAIHVQASGGILSEEATREMDFGNRYLLAILQFIGITDVETLFVEGMNQFPDQADAIRERALERAREMAKPFAGNTASVS